jgi:hypothetical protein
MLKAAASFSALQLALSVALGAGLTVIAPTTVASPINAVDQNYFDEGANAVSRTIQLPKRSVADKRNAAVGQISFVQATGATNAVAIAKGRLLATTSGGIEWSDISPASDIASAQFLSAAQGWAVERAHGGAQDALRVWRTSSAGQEWHAASLPSINEFGSTSLSFINAQQGWLIAREVSSANFSFGHLFATTDGGATWQAMPQPPVAGQLKMIDAQTGWILGGANGQQLYQTNDGGQSWSVVRVSNTHSDLQLTMPTVDGDGFTVSVLESHPKRGTTLRTLVIGRDGSVAERGAARVQLGKNGHARLLASGGSLVLSGDVLSVTQQRGDAISVALDASGQATQVSHADGAQWLLSTEGSCATKAQCFSDQQLHVLDVDSELSFATPSQALVMAEAATLQSKRVVQSTNRGFDACTAQSLTSLQTWWNSSPYKDVNFYMGGRNRACSQANLTASWITGAMNIGWNLIPTWVGYQSPTSICTGCSKFSTNSTTARQQGIDEANLAADAAEALGLTKPNMIYYNMEKYNTTTAAEAAFMEGFSERTKQRGYVPGMYVHWTNVGNHSTMTNPLEGIWVARWSGTGGSGPSTIPDPNAITGVSNSVYVNKRIWQHYGDFNTTWGGVTIAIDANVANGQVVGKDVAQQSQTITFGALSNRVANTAAFDVSATASSGLAVVFTSQTPSICTVSGTRAALLDAGLCTIRAAQPGNASFTAAPNVDQSFTISKQTQTITFNTIPSRILSVSTFDLNATTSSGLLPSYSSLTTAICTVNGDRLTTVSLGTCTVRASQAGNSKVAAAASVDQSFSVTSSASCSTATTTLDCDMDGIPNGIEASVSRSATTKDNDVFNVTKLFIMQQFRDAFKREATATEITNWTNSFNSGTTRASMIESFYSSADFGVKHAKIARLYLAFFNRAPQWSGQNYWVSQLGTQSLDSIANAFATSAEFTTTYGTLDNDPYVRRAYQNTLGRAPTSTELSAAVADLNSGAKTRGSLMTSLSEGSTFVSATANETKVIMTYFLMLQRRADQGGYDYWLGQLDTGAKTVNGMIAGFLSSAEYKGRFVP